MRGYRAVGIKCSHFHASPSVLFPVLKSERIQVKKMNKIFVTLVTSVLVGLASAATAGDRPFHTVDFNHYWTLEEVKTLDSFSVLVAAIPIHFRSTNTFRN